MDYFDFLERHQATFFGHKNAIQDIDLITLGLHELKQLDIQNIDISYHHGVWMISTDVDWITDLVGQATQHYFLDMVTSSDHPNTTFVFGSMLIKHSRSVLTLQHQHIDWASDDADSLKKLINQIHLPQKTRVLLFQNITRM